MRQGRIHSLHEYEVPFMPLGLYMSLLSLWVTTLLTDTFHRGFHGSDFWPAWFSLAVEFGGDPYALMG